MLKVPSPPQERKKKVSGTKVHQPKTLSALCKAVIRSKKYPKEALNASYAAYIWPDKLAEWLDQAPVGRDIRVPELSDKPLPWFYIGNNIFYSHFHQWELLDNDYHDNVNLVNITRY